MSRSILFSALRITIVGAALWACFTLLANFLSYATAWKLSTVCIIGAFAAEAIYLLYRYERSAVTAKRGRWLLGLRLAAMFCLLWMLLQPVWSRMVKREILRELVVLIDDSASMHLQDDGETASRYQLGQQALEQSQLLEKLDGKVKVRTLRAARKTLATNDTQAEGWDQATDLANALETVLEQIPADNLAGAVLISDGRHNRPGRVEDVARRFGILDAPVAVIPVGSDAPPRDAAILSVTTPDAVYLGDRIRISADIKFDGFRGKKTTVRLMQGDELLEKKTITIPQGHHREQVRFRHTPKEGGVGSYRIELDDLDGERFSNNNSWSFETAVTDARTNVLIIDSHPRWEFRYLRNLFYGRDKSIHLQYVLLNPDRVHGQADDPVHASASRPFGEAHATRLPANEDEWRKFDAIIIGDIPPDSIPANNWQIIRRSVEQRGALLVTVAGPRWMPHAHSNNDFTALLPVELTQSQRTYFSQNDQPFRMALTAAGRKHSITAQSDSAIENSRIWREFPEIRWRHPIRGLKDGSELLLTAQYQQGTRKVTSQDELGAALDHLAKQKQREAENALLVIRQSGKGKVATLLTDRTWRLREGVGDVFHHRFWGQLMRWGAGPTLRSGSGGVRLGTNQLSYSGDDPVTITARLRDEKLNPIADETLRARITMDGTTIATVPLKHIADSNGLHQAKVGPFPQLGNYSVTLLGDRAEDLAKDLSTSFRVIGATSPVELAETTLNRPLLETIAHQSGGRVIPEDALASMADLFLTGEETREELRETTLWDHWLLLLLLLALLTTEWWMRRNGGLP